jgi:hypothetical protein
MVEAVPTVADGAFAETFAVKNTIVCRGVMLARDVEGFTHPGTLDNLLGGVELSRF